MGLKIDKNIYNTYQKYTPKSITSLIENIEYFHFTGKQSAPNQYAFSYNPINLLL